MESRIKWEEVRAYYEFGHTRDECQRRFGFSNGAWSRAVDRGDVVPRPRTDSLRAQEKRERVAHLRARGKTYVEIANELGLTKSTVAYHARRLGIPADERFARRYDWRLVQAAVEDGASMRQCMKRFGFSRDAWGTAVKRGDVVPNDWVTPLEILLVAGRRRSRGHIKARLVRAGLKENRCERCGLGEWQGKPLSMQLHHINGDGSDNRLENLKLLCANCHSQTSTYGGRNGHRRRRPIGDAGAA